MRCLCQAAVRMKSHNIHFQVHLSRQKPSIQKLLSIELVESEKVLQETPSLTRRAAKSCSFHSKTCGQTRRVVRRAPWSKIFASQITNEETSPLLGHEIFQHLFSRDALRADDANRTFLSKWTKIKSNDHRIHLVASAALSA